MKAELIRQVWRRAQRRCEYCQLLADTTLAPFQIDHVIARQHGGNSDLENLALACIHCNRYKGPNIAGIDRDTGQMVRLFNPRRDVWTAYFQWNGVELYGLNSIARVTIELLFMNDPEVLILRQEINQEFSD